MSIELQYGRGDGSAGEYIPIAINLSKICSDIKFIALTELYFVFSIELHFKAILVLGSIGKGKSMIFYVAY